MQKALLKLTFYEFMLKKGIEKNKAIKYFNIYCFGDIINNLEDKLYMENLVDCYNNYRNGL